MSALGWPLPSVGQWLHVGIPGQEGPGEVQVTTPFRHLMPVPITSQGPVGTHPPHGRPDILCQTPQATQVPLETTKLEGRGLGPTSRALRGLGGCRQLLLLPEAGARHKEQVTQEQLHGLGVVGRAGQGRGQGLWLWERRLGARGARGRLRAALPRHCTCLTHAMQQQCTAGPPALQAPIPPPACAAASKEGPATCSPHPPPGGATLRPEGAATLPWTQAFARRQGRLVTRPVLLADPAVFCSPRGTIQGVERPRPLRRARPPAPALTLSMELSAGVVARLSCRYPLAFSHITRLAGPDSAFPRPRMARAALKECRAALGRGFLLGPR